MYDAVERSIVGGASNPGVIVRNSAIACRLEFLSGRTKPLSGRNRHLLRRIAFLVLANAPEPGEELLPMAFSGENNLAI